jgi:hypothetical protein
MQPSDWVTLIGGVLSIVTVLVVANVWLIRSVVRQELRTFEERMKHDRQMARERVVGIPD